MKKLIVPLILILSIFFTNQLKAADILVNSSGLPGSYLKISDAVNAASNGDRILISPEMTPYIEDTLFISKDLTLMSYMENTFVSFEGNIKLILDSISNFTIIGFRVNNNFENLFSEINDSSTNSLSVINIIDCELDNIRLDQPKTSLYLSYSTVKKVAFSHGDIIGNRIEFLYFGDFDYSSSASQSVLLNECSSSNSIFQNYCINIDSPFKFWTKNMQPENNLNNSNYHSSECDLFNDYIHFGNENVYSDTCNIIANFLGPSGNYNACVNFFSLDFPFNFRNNYLKNDVFYYLLAPSSKGVNQFVNNILNNEDSYLNLAYCPANNSFNFSDVTIHYLNNGHDSNFMFWAPQVGGNSLNYAALVNSKTSFMAYNKSNYCLQSGSGSSGNSTVSICDSLFLPSGPTGAHANGYQPAIYNPSPEHLNLDLTPNQIGAEGGSHSWSNYHGVDMSWDENTGWYGTSDDNYSRNKAGKMPDGSKARITYLNLPTRIFNPTNIRVKAKAIHGNNDD